ncbi:MAG TPA: ABC transporter permease subunit [Streptosporangiaceae bacterium]|nr:ABC transporter permease subunit [Streptosporangiaceae bacterium]
MSTGTITPYRSAQRPGRDDFPHLLRSEWTKFRTVRGWVIATIAAALLTALAVVLIASAANGKQNPAANPVVAIGPGGEAVTDSFYFARQPLDGNGTITARITSLADGELAGQGPGTSTHIAQPWAKAGIIIKASTRAGSAYAAVMATPGHGVRMQYDFTHDLAGLPGTPSAASPRWLRLTRSGDTITGYDSTDGSHWTEIGTATLAGLPATAQAGLFAASPQYVQAGQGFANNDFAPVNTQVTATFDHVSLEGGQVRGNGEAGGATWTARQVGFGTGPAQPVGALTCGPQGCVKKHRLPQYRFTQSAGRLTLFAIGGDIAPYMSIVDPLGTVLKGSAVGLLAVIALGALFITAEYRRGLIRTTFAASPRRGRVLAAKAIVIGSVTFVAGLIGTAVALVIAERKLNSGGWVSSVYPVWSLTSGPGLRIVVGTAGLLAVAAVLALSAGVVLRRSAGAITAVVALLIVPVILGTILPQGPADWVLRLTPAAAFGLQQGTPQYSQVMHACEPYNGCFPLAPWNGFLVACVWAVAALGLAVYVLRRRDA